MSARTLDASYHTPSGDQLRARAARFWISGEEKAPRLSKYTTNPDWVAACEAVIAFFAMLTPGQVELLGEINRRHTIVLKDKNGQEHIPAFQFDENGQLRDIVIKANEEMGPDIDPWGVATFWSTRSSLLSKWDDETHTSVPAAPWELIGTVDDYNIMHVIYDMQHNDGY